jgi:hypothetical protein
MSRTGKVDRAVLYACRAHSYGIASRDNVHEDQPLVIFEGKDCASIMKALVMFSQSFVRCTLVLELDNQLEITLGSTLQSGCSVEGEPNFVPSSEAKWDMSVEVWPR